MNNPSKIIFKKVLSISFWTANPNSLCKRCLTSAGPALQTSPTHTLFSSSTSPSVSSATSLPLIVSVCLCMYICMYVCMIWFMLSGTTADDLFPLFDKYGKVVDIFIPRDRRLLLLSPSSQLSPVFFLFLLKVVVLGRLELGNRGALHLCATNTLMKLRRQWKG